MRVPCCALMPALPSPPRFPNHFTLLPPLLLLLRGPQPGWPLPTEHPLHC